MGVKYSQLPVAQSVATDDYIAFLDVSDSTLKRATAGHIGTGIEITQEAYDLLPAEQKANGTYYIIDAGGGGVVIDPALDLTSSNPVENKAVAAAINSIDTNITGKADKVGSATNGNLAGLNAQGNLTDSGWNGAKDTTSISGNPISITGLKSNQLAINPIITLEPIQAGSGDPSPSNVRAISGYDKIEVLSCGKNLFDKTTVLPGKAINNYGTLEDLSYYFLSDFIPVKPNTTYYLTNGVGITYFYSAGIFTKNKEFISDLNMYGEIPASGTMTIPSNAYYIRLNVPNAYIDSCQFEEGSSATTYEPYHKTTDISENIGQTVYKGSLDVRTGLLTVTHKILDLGDYEWIYHASINATDTNRFAMTTNIPDILNNGGDQYIMPYIAACSCYASSTNIDNVDGGSSRSGYISQYGSVFVITDTRYNDSTAFKTAVTGQKVVYQLATPFTIQLTPHEISLLKDYAYVSTNGTSIALDYHNGELASLSDVAQLGQTVNELGETMNAAIEFAKTYHAPVHMLKIHETYVTGVDYFKPVWGEPFWHQIICDALVCNNGTNTYEYSYGFQWNSDGTVSKSFETLNGGGSDYLTAEVLW